MKATPSLIRSLLLCLAAAASCLPLAARASTVNQWNGNGDYFSTDANWSKGHVAYTWDNTTPENGEIKSGTAAISSNSLTVRWGNSLIIDGGCLKIGSSINVAISSNGSLIVSSGTFDGHINSIDATSVLTVSGGELDLSTPTATKGGVFTLSLGIVNCANSDFLLSSASDTVSGGTLNVNYLGVGNYVAWTGNVLTFSGGSIIADRFGADSGSYVNFTLGSTGSFFLGAYSLAQVDNFITSGQIRYDGSIQTDVSAFNIKSGTAGTNDGYYITLASVPEPSSVALMALSGLGMLAFWKKLSSAGTSRSA